MIVLLITKIAFVILGSFTIGVFFGAWWVGATKKTKPEENSFDERDIYSPKIKIIKREKAR